MTRRAQESSTRAERFQVQLPVRYRMPDSREWLEAQTENVSYTGVLFRTKCILKPTTLVEVRLQLPPKDRKGNHAEVVCKCEVVRVEPTRGDDVSQALAVAIHDYRLTRNWEPN